MVADRVVPGRPVCDIAAVGHFTYLKFRCPPHHFKKHAAIGFANPGVCMLPFFCFFFQYLQWNCLPDRIHDYPLDFPVHFDTQDQILIG